MRLHLLILAAVHLGAAHYGAADLDAQAKWRLVEVARIDGSDDEGLASLNDIRDLQIGIDGRIWVLDFQTQSLRLFGADGAAIKEVAGRGRGPGEIANANGFRIAPDGRVFMRDYENARITVLDSSGKYVRDVPARSFGWRWRAVAGVDRQGRYHDIAHIRRDTTYLDAVVRYSPDLSTADTTFLPDESSCRSHPAPGVIDTRGGVMQIPFAPDVQMVFSANGATWCGSNGEYRLRRFALGSHAHDRELRLDVPRIPILAAQRDSQLAEVDAFIAKTGGLEKPFDRRAVPSDRGALRVFASDDRDRLWVLRETSTGTAEFDVWDAAGRRIATLAPGFAVRGTPLLRIQGDRLAIVRYDEDDLPTIFVYRIETR